MIIAKVIRLQFKLKKDHHTVAYAEKCQKIEMEGSEINGTFKYVVANDEEDAARKLRKIIYNWLKKIYFNPLPHDFCFEVGYDKVDDQGLFYGSLSTTNCKEYDIYQELVTKAKKTKKGE